jgi:hypothetical protein
MGVSTSTTGALHAPYAAFETARFDLTEEQANALQPVVRPSFSLEDYAHSKPTPTRLGLRGLFPQREVFAAMEALLAWRYDDIIHNPSTSLELEYGSWVSPKEALKGANTRANLLTVLHDISDNGWSGVVPLRLVVLCALPVKMQPRPRAMQAAACR